MPRLDRRLCELGLAPSRERAKEYIQNGQVFVNSAPVQKPAFEVTDTDTVELRGETLNYCGRGGLKLERALEAFDIDVSGLTCLDVGASTGGFTDCLLQHGAKKVICVDVGHGQLAEKLMNDPRVINFEGVNVKDLTPDLLPERPDLAVSDLSFISVTFAAAALSSILSEGSPAILLIKPQFEAGSRYLTKHGTVTDKAAHFDVLSRLTERFNSLGFSVEGLIPSPIKGGSGNIEYLSHLVKRSDFTQKPIDFSAVVSAAFGGQK